MTLAQAESRSLPEGGLRESVMLHSLREAGRVVMSSSGCVKRGDTTLSHVGGGLKITNRTGGASLAFHTRADAPRFAARATTSLGLAVIATQLSRARSAHARSLRADRAANDEIRLSAFICPPLGQTKQP